MTAEVCLFVSNQLKEFKDELASFKLKGGISEEQITDLREHLEEVQALDTDTLQRVQREAIQQAHESTREIAEDIAEQSVDTYIRRHQKENSKFYGIALSVSIGVFAIGIAIAAGLF